jgi:ribosomal protein S6--L-glutamate ligase
MDPSQMSLLVSNVPSGYDRLYFSKNGSIDRINIKDVDAIIPRIGQNINYGSFIVEHLSQNLGIYSTQSAEGILNAANKLRTLQILSENGLPTPRSISINASSNINGLIEKIGGFPVVVKLVHGSGGQGVALLSDRASAVSTIQAFLKSKLSILLQEYIRVNGKDFRAFVVGNRVIACYQRVSQSKNEFRANLQLGGHGIPAKISNEEKNLCVRAAKATGLSVAGIDLVRDKTGKPLFIEVNANHGFKVERITGVNVAEEIICHVENNYRHPTVQKNNLKSLLARTNYSKKGLNFFQTIRTSQKFTDRQRVTKLHILIEITNNDGEW